MHLCPTCGEVYLDKAETCALDGTRLVAWGTTRLMPKEDAGREDATRKIRSDGSVAPAAGGGPPEVTPLPVSLELVPIAADRILVRRYALRKQLGVGGFGAVFEAEDLRLEKRVAVKLLSPLVAKDAEAVARFRAEAIAASRIGHEGIVDVTDFDRDEDGTSFIVMELLDGRDLAAVLAAEGALTVPRALAIATQVAYALAAAHRKGILHRDLKPPNIYLVDEESRNDVVKVIDFGISKVMTEAARTPGVSTSQGMILGTPVYMAPEQARADRNLDGRVDVYALGVILYELLVGKPPFEGETHYAIIAKHLSDTAAPMQKLRPELVDQRDVLWLVERALKKKPEERFATMDEFADELLRVLEKLDPVTATVVRPARLKDAARSTPSSGKLRSAAIPRPATPATLSASAGEISSAIPTPRRNRVWIAAPILLALAAIAFMVTRNTATPKPENANANVNEHEREHERVNAPANPVAGAGAGAGANAGAGENAGANAGAGENAPAPPLHKRVLLTSTIPDAEAAGYGKLPVTLDVTSGDVGVIVSAPGYKDLEVIVQAKGPDSMDLTLEKTATAKPPRGKKERKGSGDKDSDIARDW